MQDINAELLERETDLEEYNLWDHGLKARLLALITRWVQIRISYWFAWKWERGGRGALPRPDGFLEQYGSTGNMGVHLTPRLQGGGEGVCEERQTER